MTYFNYTPESLTGQVSQLNKVFDSRNLGDDMEHLTPEERLEMLYELRELIKGY